jgi:tetratricopeptide (TPR) repeat protein
MKNNMLVCITFVSVFSFNCFPQIVQADTNNKKAIDNLINAKTGTTTSTVKTVKTVKTYRVVETVNLKFGGHTTTYEVPDPKLINTFDLGPNNTRVITILYNTVEQNNKVVTPIYTPIEPKNEVKTPIYTPVEQTTEVKTPTYTKVEPINTIQSKNTDPSKTSLGTKATIDSPKKMGDYAYIDVIKTYERVTEKGYKSIFMLKKVCNAYFFNDEMEKAAKCYAELFALTTDLEPEYYYRYAISLKAIGEDKKASENLKIYNQLSGNTIK